MEVNKVQNVQNTQINHYQSNAYLTGPTELRYIKVGDSKFPTRLSYDQVQRGHRRRIASVRNRKKIALRRQVGLILRLSGTRRFNNSFKRQRTISREVKKQQSRNRGKQISAQIPLPTETRKTSLKEKKLKHIKSRHSKLTENTNAKSLFPRLSLILRASTLKPLKARYGRSEMELRRPFVHKYGQTCNEVIRSLAVTYNDTKLEYLRANSLLPRKQFILGKLYHKFDKNTLSAIHSLNGHIGISPITVRMLKTVRMTRKAQKSPYAGRVLAEKFWWSLKAVNKVKVNTVQFIGHNSLRNSFEYYSRGKFSQYKLDSNRFFARWILESSNTPYGGTRSKKSRRRKVRLVRF